MKKHHICGLSLLLSAFFLSGCGTMAKKETTSIETGTVAPLVITTPSITEDVTDSSLKTMPLLIDTIPANTSKVVTTKTASTKQKVAFKKKKSKACRT